MSGLSYENKDQIIMNKSKKIDICKENQLQPKKLEMLKYDKNILEINNKHKLSTELPDTSSGSNSPREFNGHLFMESNIPISDENNVFFRGNNMNKNELPELNYFLCNEEYIKEKNPEGNNYKNKSKNFVLKSKFINNKIQIEDIDYNKINNILKDIENIENIENNVNNKNNIYIHTDINIIKNEKNNENKLTYIEPQPLSVERNYLCPYMNYRFDSKLYFIYNLFYLCLVTNNNIINENNVTDKRNEKKQNEIINKNENKPRKRLVERPGDWYCRYCCNLNFAFRCACNRCKMSKYCWI